MRVKAGPDTWLSKHYWSIIVVIIFFFLWVMGGILALLTFSFSYRAEGCFGAKIKIKKITNNEITLD